MAFRSIILLMLVCVWPALAAEAPRRVLLVHSFGRDFAPFNEVSGQFRTELARRSPQPVEFLDASLEMARFDGVERDEPLLDFLAAIFQDRTPDLVAPVGGPAAQFCLRHRAALFPQTPLLALGVDKRRAEVFEPAANFRTVGIEIGLGAILENITSVLPETREVFVMMGTAPLERFWEEELKKEWQVMAPKITFHWLSDRSLEQMVGTVRRLPPHSAVVVAIVNRDAAGIPHMQESALAAAHEAANAPIFGYAEQQLGLGIVGGRLAPMKQIGAAGADTALRILEGAAANVGDTFLPLGPPVFDARELQRWGISASALPAGSTVLFRTPGLWETHRAAVLLTSLVIASQMALIILLLAARRRARDMDASLSLAADAAHVGLWQRDLASDEVTASPRWRALFGLPAAGRLKLDEVLARLHPADAPKVRETIERGIRDGRGYDVEHRIVLPDGRVRWIASMGRADGGNGGPVSRARGVSMDVTERKRIEAELNEQRRELAHLSRVTMLSALSGSLAHELNQPLGIILSNAQAAEALLENNAPDLDELRSILADIVKADHRAGEVIKRLRAFLQRGEANRQAHDVNEIVTETLPLVRSDLIARGVMVEAALAPGLPSVRCDRVQLQQVLLNLLLNACDAMADHEPGARQAKIDTAQDGARVRLSVRDAGCGLPPDIERLFQPFVTTKGQGLGIGLAISRSIVESHGGRLWAEPLETGAAFHVELPVEEVAG